MLCPALGPWQVGLSFVSGTSENLLHVLAKKFNLGTSLTDKGNAVHTVRTQCEVLDVGKYLNPSFGPFSQVFGSIPGVFWLPKHLGCGIFELSTIFAHSQPFPLISSPAWALAHRVRAGHL